MKKFVLVGAGGKMGYRISEKLKDIHIYEISYVEVSKSGINRLEELGLSVSPQDKVLPDADIVLLAVPDDLLQKISANIIPQMKSGSIVITIDAAAIYAGKVYERKDIGYFIVHPCHPPLFNNETSEEAKNDWAGGIAKMDLVCTLIQGNDEDYMIGEAISRAIFSPIDKTYKITLEQMVILEPALTESLAYPLLRAIKEGYDETVKMGVPANAAWSFLMGHLRALFGIVFGLSGVIPSDGALLAMKNGQERILKPDWKESIFNIECIKKSVEEITENDKIN